MTKEIVIATRQSQLALWQANFIKQQLQAQHPALHITLRPMVSQGDRDSLRGDTTPIQANKTSFVKQLQTALLQHEADVAVHSLKDMSVYPVRGLKVVAVTERAQAADAFVSEQYNSLSSLPQGAIVGTSSPRRHSQLMAYRKDLQIKPCRGNLNTRLMKLKNGQFDAILLAAAGLVRLDLASRIKETLATNLFVPAIGQGVLALECRTEDLATQQLIVPLNHKPTQQCVLAEQTVNRILGGDCATPLGVYAEIHNDLLTLHAYVGDLQGLHLRATVSGSVSQAEALGEQMAAQLLTQGAKKFL